MAKKSEDKSGFGDKSGCDKSEDGQYLTLKNIHSACKFRLAKWRRSATPGVQRTYLVSYVSVKTFADCLCKAKFSSKSIFFSKLDSSE